MLGFAGWKDLFQDGMVRNYLGLHSHMYLIDGPWTHGSTFANGVTRGTTLAWFDHWLLGLKSAPMPPARIMSYEMPNGPWTTFGGWPAGTKTQTLALNGNGSMGPAAAAGSKAYTADTAAGVDPITDSNSLSFTTVPLAKDTVIAGSGQVSLTATLTDPTGLLALAPDQVETNFVFHLFDVGPDGTQTNITQGYLKASHLVSHSFRTIIDLNRAITYTIPLWHIHWRLAAGHSLPAPADRRRPDDGSLRRAGDPPADPAADGDGRDRDGRIDAEAAGDRLALGSHPGRVRRGGRRRARPCPRSGAPPGLEHLDADADAEVLAQHALDGPRAALAGSTSDAGGLALNGQLVHRAGRSTTSW